MRPTRGTGGPIQGLAVQPPELPERGAKTDNTFLSVTTVNTAHGPRSVPCTHVLYGYLTNSNSADKDNVEQSKR
eukprot:355489-Chlamydomonas_euryale.AAC.12